MLSFTAGVIVGVVLLWVSHDCDAGGDERRDRPPVLFVRHGKRVK